MRFKKLLISLLTIAIVFSAFPVSIFAVSEGEIAKEVSADQVAANAVIAKINAIGTVEYTPECEAKIKDAQKAYNALTDEQKALVTNMDVYYAADNTYRDLKMAYYAEQAKVMPLIQRVVDLGEITLEDKTEIESIRAAYNALQQHAKDYFQDFYSHNYLTDLETAETKLAALEKAEADKTAAKAVEDKINAIGKVTLDSKDAIRDARDAYDNLTDDQKALVSESALNKLIDDEKKLADLNKKPESKPEKKPVIIVNTATK